MMIRVLVADDQSMVRAGFRLLLSSEQDIEVVAEARDGLEAVDKAALQVLPIHPGGTLVGRNPPVRALNPRSC